MNFVTAMSYSLHTLVDDCVYELQPLAKSRKIDISSYTEPSRDTIFIGESDSIKTILSNMIRRGINSLHEGDLLLLVEGTEQTSKMVKMTFTLRGVGCINETSIREQIYSLQQPPALIFDSHNNFSTQFYYERENNHGFVIWFTLNMEIIELYKSMQANQNSHLINTIVFGSQTLHEKVFMQNLSSHRIPYQHISNLEELIHLLQQQNSKFKACIIIDLDLHPLELNELATRFYKKQNIKIISLGSNIDWLNLNDQSDLFGHFISKPVSIPRLKALLEKITRQMHISIISQTESNKPSTINVLIAEDDQANQDIFDIMFNDMNCNYTIVSNGLEALNAFENNNFDIVLLDCFMPEMDGFQTAQQIRNIERIKMTSTPTPIIATTASSLPSDRLKCKQAGMDDFLSKPFQKSQLDTILSQWTNYRSNKNIKQSCQTPSQNHLEDDIIDYQAINRIRSLQQPGEQDLVSKIIERYSVNAKKLLDSINNEYNNNNLQSVCDSVHKLKSSSFTIGVHRVGTLCKKIENKIRGNFNCNIDTDIINLNKEFEQAIQVISNLKDQLNDI